MNKHTYDQVRDILKKCELEIRQLLYHCNNRMLNTVEPLVDINTLDDLIFIDVDFVEDSPQNRKKYIEQLHAEKKRYIQESEKVFDEAIALVERKLNCSS